MFKWSLCQSFMSKAKFTLSHAEKNLIPVVCHTIVIWSKQQYGEFIHEIISSLTLLIFKEKFEIFHWLLKGYRSDFSRVNNSHQSNYLLRSTFACTFLNTVLIQKIIIFFASQTMKNYIMKRWWKLYLHIQIISF